jgi:murein DD-endopeptidase MepM/ murein hydrolase activator NlpD
VLTVMGSVTLVQTGVGRVVLRRTSAHAKGRAASALSGEGSLLLGLRGRGPRLLGLADRDLDLATLKPGTLLQVGLGAPGADGRHPLATLGVVEAEGKVKPWAQLVAQRQPLYGERTTSASVVVPMAFPVIGGARWHDGFLADRVTHRHLGQDLCAPKMRPLVAAFDGVVFLLPATADHPAATVLLLGDNGWQAVYTHLNDDTPGTSDNARRIEHSFAPGLANGTRVRAGELVGWIGDSGYVTGTHVHFELRQEASGDVFNAAPSLRAAPILTEPKLYPVAGHLPPAGGEVRVEGFLRGWEPERGVLTLARRATTVGADSAPATQPQNAWVRVTEPTAKLLGAERHSLPLADLRPGVYMIASGRQTGESLSAKVVFAEQPCFVPDAPLAVRP